LDRGTCAAGTTDGLSRSAARRDRIAVTRRAGVVCARPDRRPYPDLCLVVAGLNADVGGACSRMNVPAFPIASAASGRNEQKSWKA